MVDTMVPWTQLVDTRDTYSYNLSMALVSVQSPHDPCSPDQVEPPIFSLP